MSVQVNQLSKLYGTQKAVDNISFEAKPGEVLGFLGPNGAGKSTTMKIITCFIPQNAGTATVCGFDVRKQPMEVRRKIGYLPENNPLYLDMYVREYLRFVGQLNGMKSDELGKRVNRMIEVTGLEREQKKKIGQLSKGYRQRVGLAQAMLHEPEVLILDEPTSGLDPNQLAEIRALIKNLGKEKTVILSTHIMQEVQSVCDRVVIINRGKLVANNTVESLQKDSGGQQNVLIEFNREPPKEQLEKLPQIERLENLGNNQWRIVAQSGYDIRADIFNFAVQNQLTLLTLHQQTETLEEVFRKITS